MFVYARDADRTLVLAAGVPPAWFDGKGVAVEKLRTPYGPLGYTIRRSGKRVTMRVSGRAPPGGLALPWPFEGTPGRGDGQRKAGRLAGRRAALRPAAARITFEAP